MSSSDIPVIILDSESSQVGPNACDRRRISSWSVLWPLYLYTKFEQGKKVVAMAMR